MDSPTNAERNGAHINNVLYGSGSAHINDVLYGSGSGKGEQSQTADQAVWWKRMSRKQAPGP